MSLASLATFAAERAPLPDAILRLGVGMLVGRTRERLHAGGGPEDSDFARRMVAHAIAENTAAANSQHYEMPATFFRLILGPRQKYSCGLYEDEASTLAQAEDQALAQTCVHADLADGQSILELGCGWGSLSLWMAERYPGSRITAVSNSRSQRSAIVARARARGLANLTVVTADMNSFTPQGRFDRVVSVEMFEHMANWRGLLARAADWLNPDGRLFLHVFTHKDRPYRFDLADRDDWIARHFFSGGIMPSQGLIRQFPDLFTVEAEWRWSGEHYQRTAEDWLANFDANSREIGEILRSVYGAHAAVWKRRWRLFFLATAGLFGEDGGATWGVSHYRLRATGGLI